MKILLAALLLMIFTVCTAEARVHVRGYNKKSGTHVSSHSRSNPHTHSSSRRHK